jgi:hypothetical protein
MKMELKIIQQEALKPIEFNFEELKQQLTERLKFYNSLTYGEDEIRTAKTDRATLNKFKEAIENRRKEIKKIHMKPYEDFEKKIKEIVAMIDQPILAIDGQVKAFEDKVKAEKKAEIETLYNQSIGDLKDLLPLDKLWNTKWLNSTFSMKAVEEEITGIIAKVKNDLEVISGLKSEFELQIKDVYLRTLNLSAALQEKTRLEDQKAKQEAYNKAQLEKIEATKENTPEPIISQPEPKQEQEIIQMDFRVWVTMEQLQELKLFLHERKIKYGRVN